MAKNRAPLRYIQALGLAAALGSSLLPAEARAASCSFTDVAGVSFGVYNVFNPSPLDSTGSITFLCSGVGAGDSIVIELSAGGAASALQRRMTHLGSVLYYNLYLDAGFNAVWGNGAAGTARYGPVTPPSGIDQTLTIFGRIPARQNVQTGTYNDTIIATILF